MGQQQLLLLILGVIVVGIAVAVGITQFSGYSIASNKDAITASLMSVAADAYHYRIRPTTMGGGSHSYIGYAIPNKLASDENGVYAISGTPTATQVVLTGTSSMNAGWVATMTVDSTGKTTITYAGW